MIASLASALAAQAAWRSVGPAGAQGSSYRGGDILFGADGETVWLASRGRVFRSTDRGTSWSATAGYALSLAADAEDPATLWGVSSGTVVLSEDAGASWQSVFTTAPWDVPVIVPHPEVGGLAWVIYRNLEPIRGTCVDRTRDRGRTWERRLCTGEGYLGAGADGSLWWREDDALIRLRPGARRFERLRQPGLLPAVTNWSVDTGDPERLWVTGEDGSFVDVSTDGGRSFSRQCAGSCVTGHIVEAGPPAQRLLFNASTRSGSPGLWRSRDDGATWDASEVPANAPGYTSLGVDPHDPALLLLFARRDYFEPAALRGILRSTDGGETWGEVRRGLRGLDIRFMGVDLLDPTTWFVSLDGNPARLLRGFDRGAHWEEAGDTADRLVTERVVDPRDPRVRWVRTGQGLARSSDGGRSWTRLPGSERWSTIAATGRAKGELWAADAEDSRLFRTSDQGSSFSPILTLPLDGILSVAVDPFDPRRISVEAWRYVGGPCAECSSFVTVETVDGGASWELVSEFVDQRDRVRVVYDPVARGIAWRARAGTLERRRATGEWRRDPGVGPGTVLEVVSGRRGVHVLVRREDRGYLVRSTADGGRTWQARAGGVDPLSGAWRIVALGDEDDLILEATAELYRWDTPGGP